MEDLSVTSFLHPSGQRVTTNVITSFKRRKLEGRLENRDISFLIILQRVSVIIQRGISDYLSVERAQSSSDRHLETTAAIYCICLRELSPELQEMLIKTKYLITVLNIGIKLVVELTTVSIQYMSER